MNSFLFYCHFIIKTQTIQKGKSEFKNELIKEKRVGEMIIEKLKALEDHLFLFNDNSFMTKKTEKSETDHYIFMLREKKVEIHYQAIITENKVELKIDFDANIRLENLTEIEHLTDKIKNLYEEDSRIRMLKLTENVEFSMPEKTFQLAKYEILAKKEKINWSIVVKLLLLCPFIASFVFLALKGNELLMYLLGLTSFGMVSFDRKELKLIKSEAKKVLFVREKRLENWIEILVIWAKSTRRYGMISLEEYYQKEKNKYVKEMISNLLEGQSKETIKGMMSADNKKQKYVREKIRNSYIKFLLINMFTIISACSISLTDFAQTLEIPLVIIVFVILSISSSLAYIACWKNRKEEQRLREFINEGILLFYEGSSPLLLRKKLSAYLLKEEKNKLK